VLVRRPTRLNWPTGESGPPTIGGRRPRPGGHENELRHFAQLGLSSPVGKTPPKRQEISRPKQGSARGDSSPASISPDANQKGRPSYPRASPGKDEGGFISRRGKVRLLGLLLFLLVGAVFLPALRHDFIYYDDPGFVMENAHVKSGLTWANVKWAFLNADFDYWRPLSWCSHMVDCEIFDLAPWGHHLTSVLLHALNSLLVFVVWRKMTGAVWRSLLVAALFGLHPLHVESVAWIAERKDVLSTLFWLLTLWAYAHWVQQRAARRPGAAVFYGLALGFFVLGLMTKPMLVTVPCVLLLLDVWPLNRMGRTANRPPSAVGWSLVIEKIPFFAVAAAVGIFTVLAQKQVGALKTVTGYPWLGRIANSLTAYCQYLGKGVFPTKLAVFYPYPSDHSMGAAVLAGGLLAGVTLAVCGLFRRRPYLLVGWLWFLGTLVPVIGLVQVGEQSMADRYSYMPLVGVFVMAAWTVGDLAARWPQRSGLLGATAGAILAGCMVLTSRQLAYWQDSTTLFRHALAVTEDNWAAHTYLGYALAKSPVHLSEAIAEYQEALRIAPRLSVAHNYLGNALVKIPGRQSEAGAEFQAALRLEPTLADAHCNLATILAGTPGRLPEAILEYREAVRLRPKSAAMHYHLGLALAGLPDRRAEAIAEFRTALQLDPDSAAMHYDLGLALVGTPDLPAAIAEYRAALQLKPDYAEAHHGLGLVLERTPGRLPEAIAELQTALRLQPDSAEMHYNLGIALAGVPDRRPEAIGHLEAALRINPGFDLARTVLDHLRAAPR
jgi:tetratricopeptide (TPR) repeat protein